MKPITLRVLVGNKSPQPAFHTIVFIGLDGGLLLRTAGDFGQTGAPASRPGTRKNWVSRKLSSPHMQPIFQEGEPLPLSLTFAIKSEDLS